MKIENKAAFGIFRRESDVVNAKDELGRRGFSRTQTSFQRPSQRKLRVSEIPETLILIGPFASVGGLVGGFGFLIIGFLMHSDIISMLSVHSSLVLHHQVLTMFGLVTGGAFVGASAGALIGIGTPPGRKNRYASNVKGGGTLLSVHVNTSDESRAAEDVLGKAGAIEVAVLNERETWAYVNSRLVSKFKSIPV